MLKRQKKAMWLDIFKLLVRIPALLTGIFFKDLYLALILFSIVGLLFTAYGLYWYLYLARTAINKEKFNKLLPGELDFVSDEIHEF